jgi:uncharacterized protein YoxC
MQTVLYTLAIVAAAVVIIAVPLVTARALLLMHRVDTTRSELAKLIADMSVSLHHVNRVLARSQEGADRLRHALERIEHLLALLQPAAAVGGLVAGARRAISGHRETKPPADREGA